MKIIEQNKKLTIKPKKNAVLSALGCKKGDIIYESVSNQFDTLFHDALNLLDVKYTITSDDNSIYVSITAGAGISALSDEYFGRGEAMAALIINSIADEALFNTDSIISERLKFYCAEIGKGIKERLEAPSSLPLSSQEEILNNASLDGVSLTDAFMLSPVKSMCYKLILTTDGDIFNSQHDCSKCPNLNCPRRMKDKGKEFTVLSDFEYTPSAACGLCIDIGTTTIAAKLYDEGEEIASISETNAQRRFGADVLSRIEAYNGGRSNEIKSALEYQLLKIINELNANGKTIIAAGNTAMTSFLMGYDCSHLGMYPFKAESLDSTETNHGIKLVGGMSPFVGGDITAGLYMLGFNENEDINMLIDIGTNGEMAIGNRHKIICTSTAAGPAFEGGGISCGTGSVDGAICAVSLKDNIIKTINNKKPVGICGTGIVELCSELLDCGYMDNTGRLIDSLNGKFSIAENIVFTQQDVRSFQTAKSAIRSGIEILIAESGISADNIKNIYIAGGFGQKLNIEKACRTGLLPDIYKDKYKTVGNSSLGGCVKLLENKDGFAKIDKIKNISSDFSLAEHKNFSDLFLKYMYF